LWLSLGGCRKPVPRLFTTGEDGLEILCLRVYPFGSEGTAMATVAGFPQAQPKSTATFTQAKYRPRLAFSHISISFV